MPGLEDWINKPLEIVQNLFNSTDDCHQKVAEYFGKRITEQNGLLQIPSLNMTPTQELPSNSLVRFRCMIQDMFDAEFYLGSYEVIHVPSQRKYMRSGMYKDVADCSSSEEVDLDSSRNKTMDRMTYYCISIPGENDWVDKGYKALVPQHASATTSNSLPRQKRSLTVESDNESDHSDHMDTDSNTEKITGDHNKRSRSSSSRGEGASTSQGQNSTPQRSPYPDLNFPIPEAKGMACLVKVYNKMSATGDQGLKVNDLIEVIGVLSVDPILAQYGAQTETDSMEAASSSGDIDEISAETATHNPPPSLVPRLHALVVRKLDHVNPHLPWDIKTEQKASVRESILSRAPQLRDSLHAFLTEALMGDSLAAEYLLCHLISSIYVRKEVVALGKFSLNLVNIPLLENFTVKLYQVLSALVTKSHWLPLSLNNLNSSTFTPKKDYTKNQLVSGLLQLSTHTHLVLDETALTIGRLQASGVSNVTALGNLIRWQRVEYDFSFNRLEFTSDLAILVLSEGKSLLPSDCRVPLKINPAFGGPEQVYTNLQEALKNVSWLEEVRNYLILLKMVNYTMSEAHQKAVGEDFVQMRKENKPGVSADDLHALLVLSRFLSLSRGETTLSSESWEKAKVLEKERKRRLQELNNAPH